MVAESTATELIERVLVATVAQNMVAHSGTCALVDHSCMHPIDASEHLCLCLSYIASEKRICWIDVHVCARLSRVSTHPCAHER